MAQKLLLFWRKPARRCWWEGVELEGVEGIEGKLKVWIRRVWTLEMVCLLLLSCRSCANVIYRALLDCGNTGLGSSFFFFFFFYCASFSLESPCNYTTETAIPCLFWFLSIFTEFEDILSSLFPFGPLQCPSKHLTAAKKGVMVSMDASLLASVGKNIVLILPT